MKDIENKTLKMGRAVRSFMEQLGIGTEALGNSIQKSGILSHLIAFWCMIWGVLGIFITLICIFRENN